MVDHSDMERLAVILQAMGIGLVAGKTAGGLVRDGVYNPQACRLLGLTEDELRERNLGGLILLLKPDSRQPVEYPDAANACFDGMYVDPEGRERMLRVARVLTPEAGWGELYLFYDISAVHAAEAARDRGFRQEILFRLTAGVVHDINNLLGGVMGSAELLFSKLSGQDLPQRLASSIIESSRNTAVLARRLAMLTQADPEYREVFELAPAVGDAVDLLRRNIDRQIHVQLRLGNEPLRMQGDPVLLRCLVLALGLEACRLLGRGGTLDICATVELLTSAANPNPLFPIKSGRYYKLVLRDNGAGIGAETVRQIYSAGYMRANLPDSVYPSAWQTLRTLGGSVNVTSRVGQGTEVAVYLPLAQESAGEQAPQGGAACLLTARRLILVADDEDLMRSALVQMLRSMGHQVIEATDGQQAVQLFLNHQQQIGLVILDMVMPNMDGREAYLAMKSLRPDVRVIVASGYARNNSFTQLMHEGVQAILRKPFTMRELSQAVEKAYGEPAEQVPVGGVPSASAPVSNVDGEPAGIESAGREPQVAPAVTQTVDSQPVPHAVQDSRRTPEGMARAMQEERREALAILQRAERLPEDGRTGKPPVSALLVEDEGVLREVLASMLEARGYTVAALASGTEASLLLRNGSGFTLCLFDLNLPGVNGMELCALAKKMQQGAPCYVLIMTGQEPQNVYKSVLSGGADDFLAKPFTLDLLSVRLDVAENFLHNERQRIEAEKALRESEERMTLAVENAQLGMGEVDFATGRVVASELWYKITGCPFQYPGGPLAYLRENVHPDDSDKIFRGNEAWRNMEGEVISIEFRIRQPNRGYVWLQAVGRARRHPTVAGACVLSGFFQDISARKQTELSQERQRKTLEDMVMERTEELVRINQELRLEMEARAKAQEENLRQQRKLMDTEKLASLGTLVSGVGHEINNPTQFIMLNMPFLKGAWASALPVLDEYFQTHPEFRLRGVPYALARERLPVMAGDILEGAERIEKIVRELKDYARQGGEEAFADADLRKVADSAQTLLAHFIRQHTDRFSITAPADELRIRCNAMRVEQVIINLVQNSCLALDGRDKAVRLILRRDSSRGGAQIIVEDEGHGIEERHMRHLTDPFFTTRQSSGGTGLGLSICDRIVHNHRGEMNIVSAPGQGTRVTVHLPDDPERAVLA